MLRVDVGSIVSGCYEIVSLCIGIMGRFRAIRGYCIFWVFGRIFGEIVGVYDRSFGIFFGV